MSGHVFFKERWYGFDDGMYAGARLLEILSAFDNPSEVLNSLPQSISTPELNIDLPEGSNGHKVIEELAANAKLKVRPKSSPSTACALNSLTASD